MMITFTRRKSALGHLVVCMAAVAVATAHAQQTEKGTHAPAQGHGHHQAPRASLVKVEDAWVRATVPGQSGTGGFMKLTATQALTLEGFSSKVAKHAELHEMAMEEGVMRMRSIDGLPLPAGETVALKPGAGGHHLMLMGLRQPLKDGDQVELTLQLRSADGKHLKQVVKLPVRRVQAAMTPAASMPEGMHQDHNH